MRCQLSAGCAVYMRADSDTRFPLNKAKGSRQRSVSRPRTSLELSSSPPWTSQAPEPSSPWQEISSDDVLNRERREHESAGAVIGRLLSSKLADGGGGKDIGGRTSSTDDFPLQEGKRKDQDEAL